MELNQDSDTLEMPEMAASELQTLLEIAYAGKTVRKTCQSAHKGGMHV